MPWPFVTRSTMQEAIREKDAQIADLKLRLSETETDLKRTLNEIVSRATYFMPFPKLVPERQSAAPAETRPDTPFMEETVVTNAEEAIKRGVPMNPRRLTRYVELSLAQQHRAAIASGKVEAQAQVAQEVSQIVSSHANGTN